MAFLTAEWRKLLMANYVVPPGMLAPFVPFGTELDIWQGRCYLSLVGFMFLKTRVLGIPIPFHRDFEEVNLRFYVRRREPGGQWRRGVVFIREIVPKPAISWVANRAFGEHYIARQMRHYWELGNEQHRIAYQWKPFFGKRWCKMSATVLPRAKEIATGSEEEFITEHYWGYARRGERRTYEYRVEHPRWEVYKVLSCEVAGDFARYYGKAFGSVLAGKPASVFVAEGSAVRVLGKRPLT